MNKEEAEIRLKGADDLIKLFVRLFEQIHIMNGKTMTDMEREDFDNLLGSLRNLLEESYKRKVAFFDSIK